MKIEIECNFSDDQLDLIHQELTEARVQGGNATHRSSLYAAIQLIDQARTAMKARGGFIPRTHG